MDILQLPPSKDKTSGRRYRAVFKEPKNQVAGAASISWMEGKQKILDSTETWQAGNVPCIFSNENRLDHRHDKKAPGSMELMI